MAYGIDGSCLKIYEMLADKNNSPANNARELREALEKILYYGLKNDMFFTANMIETTSYKIYTKALNCDLLTELDNFILYDDKFFKRYHCNCKVYGIIFLLTEKYEKQLCKKYGSR